MNCEQATERFLLQLAGEPDDAGDAALRAHLETCPACREATEGLALLWADLGHLPEKQPSAAVRTRFDAMLAAYRQGARQARAHTPWSVRLGGWIEGWWPRRPMAQLGAALALLVVGLGVGSQLPGRRSEIATLRHEVQSTRALIALSLLQQRSPADRLQGVAWSARVEEPDAEVLAALLETLDDDPSVNVRLAAVDALATSRRAPSVRSGLVAALPKQTSPLVQIAVIDALVQLHESNAMDALRKLADDTHADRTVRQRAHWALKQLTS